MMSPVNRRQFLSALGAGAGASAVATTGLWGPRAWAGTAPKRFILLSSSHGTVYDYWKMRPRGRTDRGDWSEDLMGLSPDAFSRALAPLHPYRSRLQILDGLSMATAELDISGYRHEKGWLHAWTGDWVHFTGADLFSTGPSLDQIVAGAIARPDRLPSLELQVEEGRPICHAGHSQQLPLEGDPRAAFDRVFGLLNSTDPLLQAQGSILDFAIEEYKGLRGYLRPADRARLAAHFDLVRQLEQRLVGLSEATCDTGSLLGLAGTSEGYDALFQSMADLVAAAFSCDLTRVATLSLGDLPSDDFGWGWYLSGDAHNDFAHRIFQDDESAQAMSDYTAAHAAQLAYLIGLLESIPDPEGGSLMDHTLIAWGSELGDGWHGYDRWCALTAGGGWHLDTGTYRHWEFGGTPIALLTGRGRIERCGLPHQHMLVDIAQAMGVGVDHIGLDHVRSKAGATIDLTGGLPATA